MTSPPPNVEIGIDDFNSALSHVTTMDGSVNNLATDRPDGIIGRSQPRRAALRAVAGRGTYVDDLSLPRMLHLAFVRSLYAHARIDGIDCAAARALDGVVQVVTGTELAR